MFDLLTSYLSKYVDPKLVLKAGVVCGLLAAVLGLYLIVFGGEVVMGIAIILTAIPASMQVAFELLYLSHED